MDDGTNKESSPRDYKPLQYLLDQKKRQIADSKGNQITRRKQNQFLNVYTPQQFYEINSDIIICGQELDL